MEQIATIVLPVFGVIGVGYLIAWSGLISRDTGDALSDFVYLVPIPVLLFRTIATAEIPSGAAPVLVTVTHFVGFSIVWVAGTLIMRAVFQRDARAGVVGGMAAAYGNAFQLGIPLTITAYGDAALVPMTLVVAAQVIVLLVVGTILIEHAAIRDKVAETMPSKRETAIAVAKTIVTNPLIISVVAGVVWRMSGVSITGPLAAIIDQIGRIAGPLALLALGLGLRKFGISGNVGAAFSLTILKLLVMPAIALLLVVYVVPLPPLWAKVSVIVAACPSGSNVYVVAARFRTGEGLASSAIVLAIGLAVLSMTFWLNVVDVLL
jgi:malonate transporter